MSASLKVLCFLAGLSLTTPSLFASDAPSYSGTLAVRELYDNNVFIQDAGPLAPGQTMAASPANADAFVTDVGASVGMSWKISPALQLDTNYAAEVFRFSRFDSENHTDHRLSATATGADGAWRYEGIAGWLSTVGSHDSPIFSEVGGAPPCGSEPVRSRRAQDIYKLNGRVVRDLSHVFVRGVFSSLYQDFHTRESAALGYANYVDRGEWSAGADCGWKVIPGLSLVAGMRWGEQHQPNLLGIPLNYSNTMTRWLLGAEGKLNQKFKFNLLAGPDVREFDPMVRPGFERHQTSSYLELGATWAPTKTDQLTLSGRRFLWLSSGGCGAYVDGLYDLGWRHALARTWSVNANVTDHTAVVSRFNPKSPRHDEVQAVACVISHNLNATTKLDAGVAQDRSLSDVSNTPGREYHRRIFTVGCSRQW